MINIGDKVVYKGDLFKELLEEGIYGVILEVLGDKEYWIKWYKENGNSIINAGTGILIKELRCRYKDIKLIDNIQSIYTTIIKSLNSLEVNLS